MGRWHRTGGGFVQRCTKIGSTCHGEVPRNDFLSVYTIKITHRPGASNHDALVSLPPESPHVYPSRRASTSSGAPQGDMLGLRHLQFSPFNHLQYFWIPFFFECLHPIFECLDCIVRKYRTFPLEKHRTCIHILIHQMNRDA